MRTLESRVLVRLSYPDQNSLEETGVPMAELDGVFSVSAKKLSIGKRVLCAEH